MKQPLTLILPLLMIPSASFADPSTPLDINWPEFLARHDPVWEQLPNHWNEGPFLGNGQLGLVAYANRNQNRFDFHLGRTDITDHRGAPDRKTSRGIPGRSVMWDFPRLDIGRIALFPAGKIKDGDMRLDLWNAGVTGRIVTDLGEIKLHIVTLRDRMVHVIEISSTEENPDGKPAPWRWEFLPGNPATPRIQVFPDSNKDYITNPNPKITRLDGVDVCVQSLQEGGDYATAWLEKKSEDGRSAVLYVSTANEVPANDRSATVAVADVKSAAEEGLPALLQDHRAWWHEFYPRSFLTIPDPRMEAFYWIQLYKFAAASRPDAPPVDNTGPFFRVTQWPGLWWNLNVQLTYWLPNPTNHPELGRNLVTEIDQNFDGLLASFVHQQAKLGDFAWVLHNYWLFHRHSGDWKALQESWLPKARAVLEAYRPMLKPQPDGTIDLAPMESPEYHGFHSYPNPSYNLALLRWLLSAMIDVDAHERTPSPDAAEWKNIHDHLAPFPVDENGIMIGSNQPVDASHRHYSHLLGLYPLFVLDPDAPEDRELVSKSVRHWHEIDNGKELAGYSFTGGASLYAAFGEADEARDLLSQFLTGRIGISKLLPNTLYVESNNLNPVIETPISAAVATSELLFQSWGGKLRVFPATPDDWKDAAFHQLRGQGAFLVSALRTNGRTAWVRIHSEAGEPCVLKVPDWKGPLQAVGLEAKAIKEIAPGEYRIPLNIGQSALLQQAGDPTPTPIRPLPIADSDRNIYGVKRGQGLTGQQAWPERPLPLE